MTAPHFFAEDVSGDRVTLSREDSRHGLRVLRLRPGEAVTISDGAGAVVDATVGDDPERLVGYVTARRVEERPHPAIHVAQAIPKKGKLDLVVQKLTELGVASIRPFAGSRSIPRWGAEKGASQAERLRDVARQAAMQSRRAWLPAVLAPVPAEVVALEGSAIVLHESAATRLTEALPGDPPGSVTIVVGPEGGLSEQEVSVFAERGAVAVTLGPVILRTETAGLAAVAVVSARYGQLG